MTLSVTTFSISFLDQPLDGTKVSLRTFQERDITPAYICWLNDPQVVRYSNQRFRAHSMDSCRAYMESFVGSDNMFIAIYHEGAFIGTMTAYCSAVHGTCDIGLLISPNVQGKGLGKDAWGTLMAHLLATGTRKVTGGTLRCNEAMVRIMQRSGMQADGVRAGQELVDGVAHDMLHFAKFA
jgi:RimJ/RimL family protein N-acetyltransferase